MRVWGCQNQSQIVEKSINNRLKIETQAGVPLGIDFRWILILVGSEAKLGGKIEPRSMKNRSKTASKNDEQKYASMRLEGVLRSPKGGQ